jgi:hypothetical protein
VIERIRKDLIAKPRYIIASWMDAESSDSHIVLPAMSSSISANDDFSLTVTADSYENKKTANGESEHAKNSGQRLGCCANGTGFVFYQVRDFFVCVWSDSVRVARGQLSSRS